MRWSGWWRSTQLSRATCPSLKSKRVTPHVLRHATAIQLLQAGVERSVIALWLGHEQIETTQMYLDADLAMNDPVPAWPEPSCPAKAQKPRIPCQISALVQYAG